METEVESTKSTQIVKRGRAKKTTASGSTTKASKNLREIAEDADADIDLDDDPLDSIERPSSPEVHAAPISKPRRGRAKAAVSSISEEEQSRKKTTRTRAIKSEIEDIEAGAFSEQSVVAKPPARKGTTKQSSSKSALLEHQNNGKENTPDRTSGPDESVDTSKLIKTKTVRSRTISKTSKTTEEARPAQRQTRARKVK